MGAIVGFLTSVRRLIGLKETQFRAAVTANLARKIGQSTNFIADNTVNLPVGAIISSVLDEATLQSIKGNWWVLCNGQSAAGSAYQTITGNGSVPDMRGRFLRGKNNGSGVNPDGELALGAFQSDQFAQHEHVAIVTGNLARELSSPTWVGGDEGEGGPFPGGRGAASSFSDIPPVNGFGIEDNLISGGGLTVGFGVSETNPAYSVVNFFIKINPTPDFHLSPQGFPVGGP